ncbi:MAG: glycosyltransferase family 39 protein [Saprospiraceae bacterium]
MDINIVFGILSVTLSLGIYYLAFIHYKRSNPNLSLLFVLLAGLILRIYVSCDFYLHEWDERYHALVAKNILENPFKPMLYIQPLLDYDYRSWSDNHVWVHKQPVPLYTMALSLLLFGVNEIALRIPSIILSTLGIWTTFKIGKLLYSEKIGFIAAFLYSINGLIIEQTAGRVATDHIDIFFCSFIGFAVYFLLTFSKNKNHWYFFGGIIFTSLAILSKWLPALIVLPIWIWSAQKSFKTKEIFTYSLWLIFIVSIIVTPWQMYILHQFPLEAVWEFEYNRKHIFEVLGPHGHPFYYHFDKMRIIFGELIYIPFLWMIYITWQNFKSTSNVIILTWILIPYIFFSIVQTKMYGYILFTAPAIFILTAVFFDYLKTVKFKYAILTNTIAILLILLPIRYSYERIKPFSNVVRTHEWIKKIQHIEIENNERKMVIFNFKHAIEAMFYTDMIVYEKIPDKTTLIEIINKGYKVYIDNWQHIPEDLQKIESITYTNISNKDFTDHK